MTEQEANSAGKPDSESAGGALHQDLVEALERDTTRLGEVFRLTREGLDGNAIAARLGVQTSGFVYSYRQMADVILGAATPSSPTLAASFASRVREWVRQGSWSLDMLHYLNRLEATLNAVASDSGSRALENKHAVELTAATERKGIGGVYVYSYPHYLR